MLETKIGNISITNEDITTMNVDIIVNADAIVDIGPNGGDAGGNLIFAGPKEKILSVEESYTAQALKKYLAQKNKKTS